MEMDTEERIDQLRDIKNIVLRKSNSSLRL